MGVNTRTTKERIAIMDISIEIDNLEELNKVQKVIRKVDSVYEVRRKKIRCFRGRTQKHIKVQSTNH